MARKIKTKSTGGAKTRIISKFIYYFALISFLGVIFYVIFFSRLLAITSINVSGTQNIETKKIIDLINNDLNGKYFRFIDKNNLFLIRVSQIRNQLTGEFKKIKNVDIKRKFPSELLVNIQERKPALILQSSDRYFITDGEGQAFEEISTDSPDFQNTDWIILKDNSNSQAEINDNVLPVDFISFVLAAKDKLKSELDIDLERESETPNKMSYEVRVKTKEGWMIYFDANLNLEKEIGTLKAVLDKISGTDRINLEYIDLRSDNKAFYKFRDGSQQEVNSAEQKNADQQPKVEEKKKKKK